MKKYHILGTIVMLFLTAFFILLFQKTTPKEKSLQIFDVFDTYSEILVVSKNPDKVLFECNSYLHDLNNRWSFAKEQSEIGILNSTKKSTVSSDTIDILKKTILASKETYGYFDVTIGNIINLWDFKNPNPKVPDKEILKEATKKSGYKFLEIDEDKNCVTLKNDICLNLGGIAKGYATDKLVTILKNHSVPSALINLGGNVYALGKNKNNEPFSVGVQDPKIFDKTLCTIKATNTAVVTSGSYQRYFEVNNVKYHHILNPFDGMSASSGLLSVTVVSPDATKADILSTAFFAMGYEKSLPIIKSSGVFAIFVTEDNKVYYSEELCDVITNQNPEYDFLKITD